MNILGIHHVTAIAGDPQSNLDFYAGALRLRLYYGDELGRPGTILTLIGLRFPGLQPPAGCI